jgi:hypothetical protein
MTNNIGLIIFHQVQWGYVELDFHSIFCIICVWSVPFRFSNESFLSISYFLYAFYILMHFTHHEMHHFVVLAFSFSVSIFLIGRNIVLRPRKLLIFGNVVKCFIFPIEWRVTQKVGGLWQGGEGPSKYVSRHLCHRKGAAVYKEQVRLWNLNFVW